MADNDRLEEKSRLPGVGTLVLGGIVAVALVSFVVQNTNEVQVSFLFVDRMWPLWLVIVVSAVAGAVLSEIVGWALRRRRRE